MPIEPDETRHPLPGMSEDRDAAEPTVTFRLPVSRSGPHPIVWVAVAAGMLVVTFFALHAVLAG